MRSDGARATATSTGRAPLRPRPVVVAALVVLLALVAGACTTSQEGNDREARRQARERQRAERQKGRPCRGTACPPESSGAVPPSVPPTMPQPPEGSLKPVLRGLLDRDGPPPSQYVGVAVDGFVVKATWADLQLSAGGPITPDNAIDKALADVRRLNAAKPATPLGLRLRIYGGVDAPVWAKSIGGPPIAVTNPESEERGTIGRFWDPAYGAAYADLQQKLAARYDTVPELRDVVISRCTTFFAEPFIRQKRDAATISSLLAAGFTTDADHRCHREQIAAHDVWRQTRSDLELNPYQDIERKGRAGNDEGFTEEMMTYCRSVLGPRCVLQNNSIKLPPKYPQLYDKMKELGRPLSFQTATPAKLGDLGDLKQTIEWAVSQQADSVELPGSYRNAPPQEFAALNTRLSQGSL